jgi:hypothetical protein
MNACDYPRVKSYVGWSAALLTQPLRLQVGVELLAILFGSKMCRVLFFLREMCRLLLSGGSPFYTKYSHKVIDVAIETTGEDALTK